MHDVLAQALLAAKTGAVHLGRRCIGLAQTADRVELRFETGEPVTAKLVVGADGLHSVVRKSLFGAAKPEFCGLMAWRGIVPVARVPATIAWNIGTNWIGPGGHAVHYPLRGGTLLNVVGLRERTDWTVEGWNVRGTTEEMLNDFRGWHPDLLALFRNIDEPYKWALALRPTMERWSRGRCTLVGDACHPMVPFLAQGAVMAIEDGFVLARCLQKYAGDYATALARYEAVRRDRANKAENGFADISSIFITARWPTPTRRKPTSHGHFKTIASRSDTIGCSPTTRRGAGVRRQHLRILNVTRRSSLRLLQRIAGFRSRVGMSMPASGSVQATTRTSPGCMPARALRPQDRQRTFEAAQIEGLFRHRQGSQKSWLILIIRAVVAVKPKLEPGISS